LAELLEKEKSQKVTTSILIQKGEQLIGPYSLFELKEYIEQGLISEGDFGRQEGSDNWVPAGELVNRPDYVNQTINKSESIPRENATTASPSETGSAPSEAINNSLYIFKENQQWGPYSIEELNGYISTGIFSTDDFIWSADQANWIPISQLPSVAPDQSPESSFYCEGDIRSFSAHEGKGIKPTGAAKCPKCGYIVDPQQVICISCGNNLRTNAQLDTVTDSPEWITHKKYLENFKRFKEKTKLALVYFILPVSFIYIAFSIYSGWEWRGSEVLAAGLGLCLLMVVASLLIFRLVCSIVLIPKQHRIILLLKMGLIYGVMISLIIFLPKWIEDNAAERSDWPEIALTLLVLTAIPISLLTPNFVILGISRLNGKYTKSWPMDGQENWTAVLGPYQEQYWAKGKLISFKQWDREGRQMSLDKYGYKSDGTSMAPRTAMPLKYRLFLDPYGRWWIWAFTKAFTIGLFKRIFFGV